MTPREEGVPAQCQIVLAIVPDGFCHLGSIKNSGLGWREAFWGRGGRWGEEPRQEVGGTGGPLLCHILFSILG